MILNFWDFKDSKKKSVAIVTENDKEVTYGELYKDIMDFEQKLPKERSLVFLYVCNSYLSLVAYLACLRKKHPFLILDLELDKKLVDNLIFQYRPNVQIKEGMLEVISSEHVKFHEDLAMMLSTSGTTGSPKLVRLSYDNISSNAKSISSYLNIKDTETAITSLPMSYSYGLSVINSHLEKNAKIVLNSDSVISKTFWDKVNKYQVSTFSGVPFTFQMLKKLNYKRLDSSSIRYLTQAGGKLDHMTLEYFANTCGELNQEFFVMYGQTEASPRISYVPSRSLLDKLGSIGVPIPGGDLQVWSADKPIDESGREGELVYYGENVMMGYAKTPADFALPDTQGNILKTGDLGYKDSDGFFYITGRAKRFIKLFGLRISLDSVDSWLNSRGLEAVCMGSDDELKIIYSLSENQDVERLKAELCDEFKLNVNFVRFQLVSEIPRKNGGKIDFNSLGELIESEGK